MGKIIRIPWVIFRNDHTMRFFHPSTNGMACNSVISPDINAFKGCRSIPRVIDGNGVKMWIIAGLGDARTCPHDGLGFNYHPVSPINRCFGWVYSTLIPMNYPILPLSPPSPGTKTPSLGSFLVTAETVTRFNFSIIGG